MRSPRSRPWTGPHPADPAPCPARMTHDYVQPGTTSLFAAMDIACGSVIAQHYRRHPLRSSSVSSSSSTSPSPTGWNCTWSAATTPATRPRRTASGWCAIRGSTCTSPRPAHARRRQAMISAARSPIRPQSATYSDWADAPNRRIYVSSDLGPFAQNLALPFATRVGRRLRRRVVFPYRSRPRRFSSTSGPVWRAAFSGRSSTHVPARGHRRERQKVGNVVITVRTD
jgi:hypothetical protein